MPNTECMFTESNSIGKETARLPLFFFIITVFLYSCPVFLTTAAGQDISKVYVVSAQQDGFLYFVVPQEGFRNPKSKATLSYDITYKTSSDSAIFNFSFYHKNELTVQELALWADGTKIEARPGKLFILPEKELWHYRYTAKMRLTDLEKFFNQTAAPVITVGTPHENIELKIKPKVWREQSANIRKVFATIRFNK